MFKKNERRWDIHLFLPRFPAKQTHDFLKILGFSANLLHSTFIVRKIRNVAGVVVEKSFLQDFFYSIQPLDQQRTTTFSFRLFHLNHKCIFLATCFYFGVFKFSTHRFILTMLAIFVFVRNIVTTTACF